MMYGFEYFILKMLFFNVNVNKLYLHYKFVSLTLHAFIHHKSFILISNLFFNCKVTLEPNIRTGCTDLLNE